jgi:hypothetical protein
MAWTTPKRWSFNELVTAAMLNTHVRDNLNASETAIVSTAGDMVYATAANTVTRIAAASVGGYLTVASSGSVPAWGYDFIPLSITTTASTYSETSGAANTADLYVSPNLSCFVGTANALYMTAFITLCTLNGSTTQMELQFRAGSSGCYFGNWISGAASHALNSASLRGGWYNAWILGKGSASQDIFMMGPRTGSVFPFLNTDCDMYIVQASTTDLSPSKYSITVGYQAGACFNLTAHYVAWYGIRSV